MADLLSPSTRLRRAAAAFRKLELPVADELEQIADAFDQRVTDLLAANTREVERRRAAEDRLAEIERLGYVPDEPQSPYIAGAEADECVSR